MNKQKFEAMDDNEVFNRVLEGTLYYSSVHTPNRSAERKFNARPFYAVTVGLDDENQKKAEEYGLKIREANEHISEPHVVIKRKVKEGDPVEKAKPDVVDELQNPIPESILIGNGSKGLVKFATYWYDANGGGVGTTLFKVQITDLVEYERDNRDPNLVYNEDGFNINDLLGTQGPEQTEASNDTNEKDEKLEVDPDIFDD